MAKEKKHANKRKDSEKGKKADPAISEEKSHWTQEKLDRINAYLEKADKKLASGKNLKTELQSLQYRMEYYLLTNNTEITRTRSLQEFLKYFLDTLEIPFNLFAISIGTTDANLKKYLTGKRKFSPYLAMKFGAFFQMPPEIWLNIQSKNEIIRLQLEQAKRENYTAFTYENLKAGNTSKTSKQKRPG